MTVTTETFDQIDSSELFDSAVSDEPAAQEAAPVAEAEVAEQPRGPDGKFVPKAAEPVQAETTEAPPVAEAGKEEAQVPSWRLRELNDERRQALERADRAERQFQELQQRLAAMERQNAPKPEPVDIFADPNAFMKQQLTPIEQQFQALSTNTTLGISKVMNMVVHGKETVNAAEKAVEEAMRSGDPEVSGLRAKMLASDDPVGVAVDWYKSRSLLKETGGDLNAYRAKALEEALNDPAFLQKALDRAREQAGGQAKPKTEIQMPPRISRMPTAQAAGDDGDGSDGSIFDYALRR